MVAQHYQGGIPFLLVILAATCMCFSCAIAAETGNSAYNSNDERQECSTRIDDTTEDADCEDESPECAGWATSGECERNAQFMLVSCRRSCNNCAYEFDFSSLGKPQRLPTREPLKSAVKEIISNSVDYMQQILIDPEYLDVRDNCRNTHENCSQWAMNTGCADNPRFMFLECAVACKSCHHVLEMKKACARDPNGKDAIEAGGMDALFERIVLMADYSNWQPTVLARPTKKDEIRSDGTYASILSCEDDISNPCNAPSGPWIITLENFITPDEISVLMKWGDKIGYDRSLPGDDIVPRSSSHVWCTEDCWRDPTVASVRQRIARVTGIDETNYETFQLVKYTEGQHYGYHNDFIDQHTKQSWGPRLLTFFIYFNDVEKGGATHFPTIQWPDGLTVEPRQGRVLIWPSVSDRDLLQEDSLTYHASLPVEKGVNYAVNAWIHMRDFQVPFGLGCPS